MGIIIIDALYNQVTLGILVAVASDDAEEACRVPLLVPWCGMILESESSATLLTPHILILLQI